MKAENVEFSKSALETFNTLKKEAKTDKKKETIYKSVLQKIIFIKDNVLYGNPIAKRLVPENYKKGNTTNIFRVELPQYWRMLYTIRKDEKIEIIAIIIDIVNHEEYNKLFKYKKK